MSKLRWKLQPRETGLRAIGAGPRGSELHDGEKRFAVVSPTDGDKWYWVAGWSSGLPHKNTWQTPVATVEEAKAQAMAYVKEQIRKVAERTEYNVLVKGVTEAAKAATAELKKALATTPDGEWVSLDTAPAMQAAEDMGQIKAKVVEHRKALGDVEGTTGEFIVEYLNRAENVLEYTLATFSLNADGSLDAHIGRAGSATRQLAGLISSGEEQLARVTEAK